MDYSVSKRVSVILLVLCLFLSVIPASAASDDSSVESPSDNSDRQIEGIVIGPGVPPEGWDTVRDFPQLMSLSAFAVKSSDVPALDWSYGCAATSAAMYFGYYDRNGYPDFYTGEVDGGTFPLTNEAWGNGECPLSASHLGIENRTTRGHVDDYWSGYDGTLDPYYGKWTEHSPQDCIADYMGTNQYMNWQNIDGATLFFFYSNGDPLYDYSGAESEKLRDGTHGLKLFAESLGYTVTENFNQLIYGHNGNTLGFTYDQFKAEIDAGNPVLIHVEGHTMLGVGYSGTDQIIVHNTWDYSSHTMTWGGYYQGMKHFMVSVIHLAPAADFTATPVSGRVPMTVSFTDMSGGNLDAWAWDFGDGDTTNATVQNPLHTYAAVGNYTVTLTVTGPYGSDSVSRTDYITVKEAVIPIPPNTSPPTDPDGDGTYEDLNGNGRLDFADVVLFFNEMDWIAANEPVAAFDLNGNGRIDFADIVALFNEI